eukprot:2329612-Prymnesium_polylepis.1
MGSSTAALSPASSSASPSSRSAYGALASARSRYAMWCGQIFSSKYPGGVRVVRRRRSRATGSPTASHTA